MKKSGMLICISGVISVGSMTKMHMKYSNKYAFICLRYKTSQFLQKEALYQCLGCFYSMGGFESDGGGITLFFLTILFVLYY